MMVQLYNYSSEHDHSVNAGPTILSAKAKGSICFLIKKQILPFLFARQYSTLLQATPTPVIGPKYGTLLQTTPTPLFSYKSPWLDDACVIDWNRVLKMLMRLRLPVLFSSCPINPSKHKAFTQCGYSIGPTSQTIWQHCDDSGKMLLVFWGHSRIFRAGALG